MATTDNTPEENKITVPADSVIDPKTVDAAPDATTDVPAVPATPAEQQKVNQANADKEDNEEAKEQDEEAKKEGTNPFNAEYREGKLIVKIKLTEDILFLNSDLRSLGYRAGEIVEFSPIEKPDAEVAQDEQ